MSHYSILQCPQCQSSHVCYTHGSTLGCCSVREISSRINEIALKYVPEGSKPVHVHPREVCASYDSPTSGDWDDQYALSRVIMDEWPTRFAVDYNMPGSFNLASYNNPQFNYWINVPRRYPFGDYNPSRYYVDYPSFQYWTLRKCY